MEQENGLFRTQADSYGAEYKQHLLEQYKLFVESADRVSERRTSANNYLLTVNAFLVTLYGLASSFGNNKAWLIVVPTAGVLVCITWLLLVRSYRNLNTAKFKVIHELEQRLPAALFDREWDHAQRGDGKAYKPLTHIEPYIPLVFAALYVILAVYALTTTSRPNPSLPIPASTNAAATFLDLRKGLLPLDSCTALYADAAESPPRLRHTSFGVCWTNEGETRRT